MGTNIYWHKDGVEEDQHVGKFSCGWKFAAAKIGPTGREIDPYTLDGLFNQLETMSFEEDDKNYFLDEYGTKISADDICAKIIVFAEKASMSRGQDRGEDTRHKQYDIIEGEFS